MTSLSLTKVLVAAMLQRAVWDFVLDGYFVVLDAQRKMSEGLAGCKYAAVAAALADVMACRRGSPFTSG